MVRYLDDFLFIVKTEKERLNALLDFREMCSSINIPIAVKKTEGPVTSLIFLGYHVDTVKIFVSILEEKINKYKEVKEGDIYPEAYISISIYASGGEAYKTCK